MKNTILTIMLALAVGIIRPTDSAVAGDEQWDDRFTSRQTEYSFALTPYRGQAYSSFDRYDGSSLTRWHSGGGVTFLDMISKGHDLFVSGTASSFAGIPARGVGRWDGTNWHAVGRALGVSDFGTYIAALAFVGDTLFAAGHLLPTVTFPVNSIVQFRGSDWEDVGGGVTYYSFVEPGYVWALAVDNGAIYVGGEFNFAGGIPASNIARWDGTNWSAVGAGLPGVRVLSLTFHRGDLFAAAGALYKWNGTNWSVVAPTGGRVIRSSGSDLYIGGRFDSANGVAATNIARWDGTNWWPVGSGIGSQTRDGDGVYDIVVWNNQVIASGIFNTAGGKSSTNFAVWHLPSVNVKRTNNQVELGWWKGFTNYVLESSDTVAGGNWTHVNVGPGTNFYTAPASESRKFFRLRQE